MIDIQQVQKDFDSGVMICRETIRQVIELAAKKREGMEIVCGNMQIFIKAGTLQEAIACADMILDHYTKPKKPCLNQMHNDGDRIMPRSCLRCGLGPCQTGVVRIQKDSSCG
jgi:hypothetical protein